MSIYICKKNSYKILHVNDDDSVAFSFPAFFKPPFWIAFCTSLHILLSLVIKDLNAQRPNMKMDFNPV